MISEKFDRLYQSLIDQGQLLVMFSGGVDSSLLAKLASDALGENAKAVTIDSQVVPKSELLKAKEIASQIGVNHQVIEIDELVKEYMQENTSRRCYLCRKNRDGIVKDRAGADFSRIADGLNFTEQDDFRPGMKAATEDGIWHPFIKFKVTKEEIRDWSRELKLSTWDKPATTCLASRFPYGFGLTARRLRKVEQSERFLTSLGLELVRVRHFPKKLALVEVGDPLTAMEFHEKISNELKSYGFDFVSLDLEGYHPGKMNRSR